jgi:response regulator NasT
VADGEIARVRRRAGGRAPRWRVVVVEDHAPARAALAEAVTAQGGQVLGNGNRAGDAPALVARYRPEIALVAVALPDGDGVQAAAEVVTAGRCAVVLVASHAGPDVAERAADAGVHGVLLAPVRAEEVGPVLDVAAARFRELAALRAEGERLRRRLETRVLVDRAKGLLMLHLGLSEPEAFRRIQKTAMDTRRTMADVARTVLSSPALAAPRPGR